MTVRLKSRNGLNQAQYINRRGAACPACCSADLDHEKKKLTVENGIIFREVRCLDCRFVWVEQFVLTSYRVIDIPRKRSKRSQK